MPTTAGYERAYLTFSHGERLRQHRLHCLTIIGCLSYPAFGGGSQVPIPIPHGLSLIARSSKSVQLPESHPDPAGRKSGR